ncbi:hypothetical protein A3K80_06850 [Candidatus Bathyarchaeota archaeon RBG_13_38_9]|nr:MAG: hypothetical protein A3K80_06850 [Candidatus Bathyarchaeota archaeon RBG_13_38_9]
MNQFRIALIIILMAISLNYAQVNVQASSNILLMEEGYWTYYVDSKSTLYGTGDYQGEFSTYITVLGNGTIKHINSTIIIFEKKQEINFKIEGSGHYDQETKSEIHTFAENSVIDRKTLTYLSREMKVEIEGEEIMDELIVGMPVTEFISPELSVGQYVEYYSIDGLINCQVSHGERDYEGKKLQTIVLRYSGPTGQDPWLETNGTAQHTFIFEKNTGLLMSSSSTTETTGIKGRRITTYEYQLDSTSFWTSEELSQQFSTTSALSTVETSTEKVINENEEDPMIPTDYFVPILILTIISIIVITLIEIRRNILRKNHTSQDDISESKNLEQSEI